jgi:diguanylate cyclase (GGDEF)-like protein
MARTANLLATEPMQTLQSAQVEQSFRQLPVALLANLANGLLLTFLLWDVTDRLTLLLWLVALVVVTAARSVLLRSYRRTPDRATNTRRWELHLQLGACSAGVVWGSAGLFLFVPASLPHQVFLAFVLGGMVAGAIPLLSVLGHAYACFAIPVVTPIAVQMLAVGDRVHIVMGLMILVFGLAMLAASAQLRRYFRESVSFRLQLSSAIEEGKTLQHLLGVDALTGIANRRFFQSILEKEWRRSKRDGTILSLITADIDHFKAYNDCYGHPAGDTCLTDIAKAMEEVVKRPGDITARIGGEEFAFLLPDTPLKDAVQLGELIRQRVLSLDLQHAVPAGQVTVSLGVASSNEDGIDSPRDLLSAADRALYQAKRHGRNRLATTESPD